MACAGSPSSSRAQLIQENRDNTASDDVEFWVKPGDVANIQAPALANLPATVQAMLNQATMIRNAVFRKRTNPYLIREFLNAADPAEHTLSPDYRFTF